MLKATGIVRRIDDLGRVVLPKELRVNLEIKEKDPVEIYVDGESIILKKYVVPNDQLSESVGRIEGIIYNNEKKFGKDTIDDLLKELKHINDTLNPEK